VRRAECRLDSVGSTCEDRRLGRLGGVMITVVGLDHVVLRVRDLERALAFYEGLLGLEVRFLDDYRAGLRPFVSVCVGAQLFDLIPDPTYDPEAGQRHGGMVHFCVEIAEALETVLPQLAASGVAVLELQPVPRMGANGIGLSAYVTDPDGYVVELKECSR
jgi:catechol 2,3-dioxygenase-like lactoylglutathione lyase family enzyme